MDKEARILELLEEKEGLLSTVRKEVTSTSLEKFVDAYLADLSTFKRPPFHKDIIDTIES